MIGILPTAVSLPRIYIRGTVCFIAMACVAGGTACSRQTSFTGSSELYEQPLPPASLPENYEAKKPSPTPETADVKIPDPTPLPVNREPISCELTDITNTSGYRFKVKFKVLGDWDTASFNGTSVTEPVTEFEFGPPNTPRNMNIVLRGTVTQDEQSVHCEQTIIAERFFILTLESSVWGYVNGVQQTRFNCLNDCTNFNPLPGQMVGRGIMRWLFGVNGSRGMFRHSSGREVEVLIDGTGPLREPDGTPYEVINFL